MMKLSHWIPALLSVMLLTTHCAAQSASLVPNTLSQAQQTTFRAIASQVPNPCVEPELEAYPNLAQLVDAGQTCHEAHLLASDIAFFIQAGVETPQIAAFLQKQVQQLAVPATFQLDQRPRLGSPNAPVQIVVFSDFQCPFCSRAADTLQQLYDAFPQSVSVVFKHMPLTSIHPQAAPAALVSAYAHDLGRFWEVHDTFFSHQKQLTNAYILEVLESLGAQQADLFDPEKGQKYGVVIVEDIEDARTAGVEGTPTVYLNGVQMAGANSFERMATRVQAELSAPQKADPQWHQKAREKALQSCPYPGHEELYQLLTTAQRIELLQHTNALLCPCAALHTSFHDCATKRACLEADSLLDKLITRLQEGVEPDALRQEMLYCIQQERTKPVR